MQGLVIVTGVLATAVLLMRKREEPAVAGAPLPYGGMLVGLRSGPTAVMTAKSPDGKVYFHTERWS